MPWFWQGDLQGGGVLNDMMCHSLEVGRYLLTKPGAPRDSIRPDQGARRRSPSLKWSRPEYVKQLRGVDDRQGRLRHVTPPKTSRARSDHVSSTRNGTPLIVEATTSWSFVGAGLAADDGAARAGVFDVGQHARRRREGVLLRGGCRSNRPART